MTLTVQSPVQMSAADLADLFNHAFTDYIGGTFNLDQTLMLAMLARENIDLSQSHLLWDDENPAGFVLISRQGWSSRIAAMGIVPEAQEKRLGTWFLEQVIAAAKTRGDRFMVLEAYEQNARAVRLYERNGFTIVRRLFGYTANELTGTVQAGLKEVDIYDVAKLITRYGLPDLPWQASGTSVARFSPPSVAYRLDHAYAVISDPSRDMIVIRALIVEPDFRQQGQARRLLEGLAAQHPGKKWVISPICPEEYDVFEKLGFTKHELNGVQMELVLT